MDSRRNPNRARRTGRPPAAQSETPLLISGLKAWFDARTNAYMTISTGISSWVSRAGSLGSIAWTQATGANQPAYATDVASLNGKNAVQFDGTNDYFDTNNTNAWKFLHDGTGASRFVVYRIDSTGGGTQRFSLTQDNNAAHVGVLASLSTTAIFLGVNNGSGSTLNSWSNTTAAHYARDTSRWWLWAYVDGTAHSRVSGSSLTNADTGGQDPSASNPTLTYRMGASSSATLPFKGYIAQDIYWDRVLSAAETTRLATWANSVYGVTI